MKKIFLLMMMFLIIFSSVVLNGEEKKPGDIYLKETVVAGSEDDFMINGKILAVVKK